MLQINSRELSVGVTTELSADYGDGTVPISREMHKPSSIPACCKKENIGSDEL